MASVALILENANDVIRRSRIDWYWAWRGLTCLPIATKHAAPPSRPTALRSVVLELRAAETTCTPPSTWRPSSPGRATRVRRYHAHGLGNSTPRRRSGGKQAAAAGDSKDPDERTTEKIVEVRLHVIIHTKSVRLDRITLDLLKARIMLAV